MAITAVGTSHPSHRLDRAESLALLSGLWPPLARRAQLLDDELNTCGRYVVREPGALATQLTPDAQAASYIEEATNLALAAAQRAVECCHARVSDIGLLVVASCTGYVLPGVDVLLVHRLGLRSDVTRLPLAHFGCAGGAAALANAAEWVRHHPGELALVVAVEVPSLTFRSSDASPDNLLSALVFGDGAGAVLLRGGWQPGHLHIGRATSRLLPETTGALGFEAANDGFRVIVSRRLRETLARHLPAIVEEFSRMPAAELSAIVLHPGGPGIVDTVVSSLHLDERQVAATRATLADTGNTSSAGILFVLAELASRLPTHRGDALAVAFGPGLTIELLELAWAC